mgnify:FL=1
MSDEQSFFGQIKGQIIAGIGVVITAAGGLVISQIEGILGVEEDPAPVEQVQPQQMAMPTIVINNENNSAPAKKDTVVKVVKVKAKPKPTATEKRKKEFDW